MNKIAEFFSKWAFGIVLCVFALGLVCAFGCCIHTAIAHPFWGIIGCVGVLIALAVLVSWIVIEIKEG